MSPPLNSMPATTTAETARGFRPLALAIVTVVLIILCIVLLFPFLPALAWGVALAVIAWPLQSWMIRQVPRRGLATGLTTLVVLLLIVVPGLFVAYRLSLEAANAAEQIQAEQSSTTVRDKLAATPGLDRVVTWLERVGVNVDREVRKVVQANTRDLSALIQGSLMGLVQFAVAIFILYHLLIDREGLLQRVRTLMPMTHDEADRVMASATDSIYANLYANFLTSVLDGVGGGLMFWLVGLPSPVMWGVVMFFLSFIPMFGTWLAWGPATIYLALAGQWPQALMMLAWGFVSAFVIGSVIYMQLAGPRMRLHQVPAMLAFLGGLAVFGVSGIVLGPVIVAVTVAVLDVWHRRAKGTAPLMQSAPEPIPADDTITPSSVSGSPRPEVLPAAG